MGGHSRVHSPSASASGRCAAKARTFTAKLYLLPLAALPPVWALSTLSHILRTYGIDDEDPEKADGLVEFMSIGPGAVSVPSHFYKVVIGEVGDQKFRAVAFVMENRKHARPFVFEDFIESINWIEERTGINFMPGLSTSIEKELERQPGELFQ